MTKVDIVERVAGRTGFTKKETIDLVELVFETLKETLVTGEDLKIPRLGKFTVRHKADRRGRNPQSGEQITIEARRVVTFKPSLILKLSMNPES